MLNENRGFCELFDGKGVRDRYERLQKCFNTSDRIKSMMSGVRGGVTFEDELLIMMRKALEELATQMIEKRIEVAKREKMKHDAVAHVVRNGTSSRETVISDKEYVENSGIDVQGSSNDDKRNRKRQTVNHFAPFEGEIELFASILKRSEDANRNLDEC